MAEQVNRRRKKKKGVFLNRMKGRLKIFVIICAAGGVIMSVNLVRIVVKNGAQYEQDVLTQKQYSSEVIPYKRGNIVDSNGTILATTKKTYDLILEPKNILLYEKNKKITIEALKTYIGMTDDEINKFLANTESYREVARKDLEYDQIKDFKHFWEKDDMGEYIIGVRLDEKYERVYPNNNLACHMIGFTSNEDKGLYGLEASYDEYLRGHNGRRYTYLEEDSRIATDIEQPTNGKNIITSIDANIQSIIEKKINEYMQTEGANNVSVLVMDPKNSNILAMYNSHTYDLNNVYDFSNTRYLFDGRYEEKEGVPKDNILPRLSDEEFEALKNSEAEEDIELRAKALNMLWSNFILSDVFEPGSTYKTFTISGALEENVVKPEDSFYCDGGEQKDIYYIKCHAYKNGGHGMVDLSGALENSCNDALMQIAVREGRTTFAKYQDLFGFGKKTNIDIPGEQSNASYYYSIYHEDNLGETELATSSFGQGANVTMMQVGTAFCSVINGGYYYEPSIAQRIEDENGNVIEYRDSVLVRRTISEEVSKIMRDELFQVVERGTGKRASVEGYTIGGKTGTAEKLPRGNGKYIISFIGFAPIEDPQVVVYVVVDEPNVEDQGSSAASSYIFADIAKELFPYLNIYKTNDNFDLNMEDAVDEPTDTIFEGAVPGEDVPENPEDGEDGSEDSTEQTEQVPENTEQQPETND